MRDPKARTVLCVGLCIAALLEFPLNHQTFAGIATELRALVRVRVRVLRTPS